MRVLIGGIVSQEINIEKFTPLKILAADDNVDCQQMLGLLLKNLGHSVTLVESGIETLEKLKNQKYDLIILDIQMPGFDGYMTTQFIRGFEEGKQRTPIVALTANSMPQDRENCLRAGMDGYLSKPINILGLKDVLEYWTNRISTVSND